MPTWTQLLAGGGGGLADQSLLSKLAALADTSLDHVISYEYDRCGRLVKQVDGENGVTVNIYNVHGELAAQVRSRSEGRSTTTAVRLRLERARGVADRRCRAASTRIPGRTTTRSVA